MSTREEPPAGWTKTTVGAVGRVQLGRQRSPKNHSGPHMRPYLRVANVFEDRINLDDVMEMNFTPAEYEVFKLEPGDILLNEGQSLELVGRPAMYRGELPGACFTNSLVRFQAGPLLDPKFALYVFLGYLHTGRFQRIATNTVNIAHLGAGRFADVEFWLPPRSEQERIVAKVDELLSDQDAGVASLKRAKANLKRYRASVLKAAVEGRLTEEWRKKNPQAEDGQMLLDRILRERREKWERDLIAGFAAKGKEPPKIWQTKYEVPAHIDGLFTCPRGWTWASALEICDRIENGNTPPPAEMQSDTGEIPFLKVYNLTRSGRLDFSIKPTFVSRETHATTLSRSRVLPDDVLMNIVGPPMGKVSIVPGTHPEWNMNQAIVLFRHSSELRPRFLMLCLMCDDVLKWIVRTAKATAGQFNISVSNSRILPIPLTSLAEQDEIVRIVEERLSQIDAAETTIDVELTRSKKLRQGILKQAFEGKLIPQNPTDKPARNLLERICRPASPKTTPKTQQKRKASR